MDPFSTAVMIARGMGGLALVIMEGEELIRQLKEGSLSPEDARKEWDRAREQYVSGRAAWDEAGPEPEEA